MAPLPAAQMIGSAGDLAWRYCGASREQHEKEAEMSNEELGRYVTDELFWDPKVDNVAIAVSADDGIVTLRGTVGSFREKREAKSAAERVYGVKGLENELQVRLMNGTKRDDADLRGDVLQALMLDSLVPSTIDAKVQDGSVTLTGKAEWQYQRNEAELVAANILGVLDVWDEVQLTGPGPEAGDIESDIKRALKRSAKLDAESLSVDTKQGKVTIKGVVSSWSEHDDAVAAAWAAPGVTDVDDRILVEY
jgi:osmotically-inducible protein OsmY